jgi:adenylate cyclase
MFKNLKIQNKILLSIMLTAVVVLSAATLYSYSFNNKIIKTAVGIQLEIASQSRAHHVDTFLTEQKNKIKIAATHSELSVEELKEIIDINKEFYEIFVLDSTGKVIVSSDKLQIGLDKSNDDYFKNGRKKTYVKDAYFSKTTKKESISISTPFNKGVLVVRIEMSFINDIIKDRTGLGKTGELYLINKDGYLITPSRFSKNTFLKTKIEFTNAKNCLGMIKSEVAKESEYQSKDHIDHESIMTYTDYRGGKVLGTHHPLHEMQWCLLAEIDESEAFVSSKNLLIFSIARILIVLLIFFVIIYLLAKTISKPIISLHKGTEIIAEGNLDHKVGTDTKDEIGQLARAFDKMTTAIKQSRLDIDKKVKEQTQEIINEQKRAEKSKISLEKMNKSMIGRELKMVELKKKIKKLDNDS